MSAMHWEHDPVEHDVNIVLQFDAALYPHVAMLVHVATRICAPGMRVLVDETGTRDDDAVFGDDLDAFMHRTHAHLCAVQTRLDDIVALDMWSLTLTDDEVYAVRAGVAIVEAMLISPPSLVRIARFNDDDHTTLAHDAAQMLALLDSVIAAFEEGPPALASLMQPN